MVSWTHQLGLELHQEPAHVPVTAAGTGPRVAPAAVHLGLLPRHAPQVPQTPASELQRERPPRRRGQAALHRDQRGAPGGELPLHVSSHHVWTPAMSRGSLLCDIKSQTRDRQPQELTSGDMANITY